MKSHAVEQATSRLRRAILAMDALNAADNFDDAEDAWVDYLMAINGIYSKLEQGAKISRKSQGWFGRKKNERKKDDLLRYLHFARNCEEHGLERAAKRSPSSGKPFDHWPFGYRKPHTFQILDKDGVTPIGGPRVGYVNGPCLYLRDVTDERFGDKCKCPRFHMDKKIEHPSFPELIAETSIPYFEGLIDEADKLATEYSASIV